MKLSCLQENLNRGLSIVNRALATLNTSPINGNVLLVTDNNRLMLVAKNPQLTISYWIVAHIEEEGSILVPARLLTNFVSLLPSEKVEICVEAGTKTLILKCARSETFIGGKNAEDLPLAPNSKKNIAISIAVGTLCQAIGYMAFLSVVEASQPILSGVYANFDGKTLTLAAADGFRLATYKINLAESTGQKFEIIIPSHALKELYRLMLGWEEFEVSLPFERNIKPSGRFTINSPDDIISRKYTAPMNADMLVELGVNPIENQIIFKIEKIEFVSKLELGAFPKYNQLIPQSSDTRVRINVQQFLTAVRTAATFFRDDSGIVILIISAAFEGHNGKLTIAARPEKVNTYICEIDAIIGGSEAKIAFKCKYLLELLGVLKEPEVIMELTTSKNPCVIKPVGADNYVHTIMPMLIQW